MTDPAGLRAVLGHAEGSAGYHGVFALCSLFHVPRRALPALFAEVFALTAPTGVFLVSYPHGAATDFQEDDGRWHTSMPLVELRALLTGAGFEVDAGGVFPKALEIYRGTWDVVVARRAAAPSQHPPGTRILNRDTHFDYELPY